jgi:hypothetical protein
MQGSTTEPAPLSEVDGVRPWSRRWGGLIAATFVAILAHPDLHGLADGASPAPAPLADPVSPFLEPSATGRLDDAGGCPLCAKDPGVPVIQMTPADADSLGRLYSTFNATLLARLDSLLSAGAWGDPASRGARRKAHLLSRMMAVNSLHYMTTFATDPDRIWEASEATLRDAFQRYSDPGVYPIARMMRGRMGMGHICVKYDVSTDLDSTTNVGGMDLRIRVEETEFRGERKRMLILEFPTILFSVVEILIAEHFTCRAEFSHSQGPPAPYDLYVFHSMDGMYVRKWGVHQPSAMMFWSTPRDVGRTQLPPTPLVGSSVYVPRVRLELPSFLPDFGFDDLRLVDLPQPILALAYLEGNLYPKWVRRAKPRGLKSWESYGPIPPDLRVRFPDY